MGSRIANACLLDVAWMKAVVTSPARALTSCSEYLWTNSERLKLLLAVGPLSISPLSMKLRRITIFTRKWRMPRAPEFLALTIFQVLKGLAMIVKECERTTHEGKTFWDALQPASREGPVCTSYGECSVRGRDRIINRGEGWEA